MSPIIIAVIVLLAILIPVILFLVLRKKPKVDCDLKVYQAGTCVSGAYSIVYDISQAPQNGGIDCISMVKTKDSGLTWSNVSGTTRYSGVGTCNDCVLKDISYNACTANKQTLRLDVSQNPNRGKFCSTVILNKYPAYVFTQDASGGNFYIAKDVSCNNCDISTGYTDGSCLGYNKSRVEYGAVPNSTYGMSCTTKLVTIPDLSNNNGMYDDYYKLAYYLSRCDISGDANNTIPASTLRYGYYSTDSSSKGLSDLSGSSLGQSIKLYFSTDASKNLIGFEVPSNLIIGKDNSGGTLSLNDISSGKFITVGATSQYFTAGKSFIAPIRIFTNNGLDVVIESYQGDTAKNITGDITAGTTIKLKFSLYNSSTNVPGANPVFYQFSF